MVESTVESVSKAVVDFTEKAPIHVLHVDDEIGFLKGAKQCLELQGTFEVDSAPSVEKAMEKMKKRTFDAIVSDYVMPGKNGLEFLSELRERGNDTPFILFTGKGREDVAIKALNLGADQYVNKTGETETVYFELAHAINKAAMRKKAEMKLRESEEEHRTILDLANTLIQSVDVDGRFVYVNKEWKKRLGYTEKDLEKLTLMDVIRKDHQPQCVNLFKQVVDGKPVFNVETVFVAKDGTEMVVTGNAIPRIKDGKFTSTTGFFMDTSERMKAEEERSRLLHSYGERVKELDCLYGISKLVERSDSSLEETLQRVTNILPNAWQYPDITGARIVYENRELKTKNFKETRWKQQADIKVHGKKAGVVEVYYLKEKPMMAEGPFLEEERHLIDAVAERLGRTIEQRAMENALIEREEKFRTIFESASDGIVLLSKSGKILDANSGAAGFFGGSREKLLGKHFTKIGIFSLRQIPKLMANFANMITGKNPIMDLAITNTKGQTLYLECSASPVKGRDGADVMMVIVRDVTERKKAEEMLQKAKERWASLTDNTDDTIVIADNKDIIRYINRTIPPTIPKEVIGKSIYDYVSKDHHNKMRESLKRVYRTGKPDSYEVALDMSAIDPKVGAMWFNTKLVPMETDREISGVIMVASNITERKEAEKLLNETLEKMQVLNEKLGVVGKLTRHDIRNKLAAARMNVFLAKKKLGDKNEALKQLLEIDAAVGLTEKILDFASTYEKLGVEQLAYMDVEKTFTESAMLFSDLHDVKVVNDCHGLTVLADSLLRQLFYNLIDNSLKHGEKISRIRVHYVEAGKDRLKLVYEDDGVGVSKVEKDKIFGEGYGKGTGYGLYLMQKMCDVYGWAINETGKHGKGAQFTMTIPKMNEKGKLAYQLH